MIDKFKTQAEVARYYADLIFSGNTDWKEINTAIKLRWSVSGLIRTKRMAWKIIKAIR